jgi:hypothetical protein
VGFSVLQRLYTAERLLSDLNYASPKVNLTISQTYLHYCLPEVLVAMQEDDCRALVAGKTTAIHMAYRITTERNHILPMFNLPGDPINTTSLH